MRSLTMLLTLLLCHASTGCILLDKLNKKNADDDDTTATKEREKPKPKPKRAAPEAEWQKYGGRLNIKKEISGHKPSVSIDLSVSQLGHFNITAARLPGGTKIELGKGQFEVPKGRSSYHDFHLDMRQELGLLSPKLFEETFPKHDFGLKLKLDMPGYKTLETDVPRLQLTSGFSKWLSTVSEGPLTFPGEPPVAPDAKPKLAMMVNSGSVRAVIGKGESLWELDWIALSEGKSSGKTKTCGGYTLGSIKLSLIDSEVTIYERRTGKALHTKRFKATGVCPRTAYVGKDRTTTSGASSKAIRGWVRYKLTGKGSAGSSGRSSGWGRMLR